MEKEKKCILAFLFSFKCYKNKVSTYMYTQKKSFWKYIKANVFFVLWKSLKQALWVLALPILCMSGGDEGESILHQLIFAKWTHFASHNEVKTVRFE